MDRYIAVRGQNREWLIVDTVSTPPRVIATSTGWNRSPDLLVNALNEFDKPISKLLGKTKIIDVETK